VVLFLEWQMTTPCARVLGLRESVCTSYIYVLVIFNSESRGWTRVLLRREAQEACLSVLAPVP
jgi:hypothetical protein